MQTYAHRELGISKPGPNEWFLEACSKQVWTKLGFDFPNDHFYLSGNRGKGYGTLENSSATGTDYKLLGIYPASEG
jgi:hypothetical protein